MGQNEIVIVTDAWEPQVNGVVRTYQNTIKELVDMRWEVNVIHPYLRPFLRVALPLYKEIELVVNPWRVKEFLDIAMKKKRHIHVASEGPLGFAARWYLVYNGYPFTTCFHTLFPEFIGQRFGISPAVLYPYFKWFHRPSKTVFAPTRSMVKHLEERGMTNLKVWSRGVDHKVFKPYMRINEVPYIICVSRVSHEKNLDAFCQLTGFHKVLIGDGPYLDTLQKRYPDVEFLGKMEGDELASWISGADVFVFPSKSDTFGIVILEAIACGTPVAAYSEPGPIEVIVPGWNGYHGDNLQRSVELCRTVSRADVQHSSKQWTWTRATQQFIEGL